MDSIYLIGYVLCDVAFAICCLTRCFNKEYNPYMKGFCLLIAIALIIRFICRGIIYFEKEDYLDDMGHNKSNPFYCIFYLPASYTCAFFMLCFVLNRFPLIWQWFVITPIRWFLTLFVKEDTAIILKLNEINNWTGREFFWSAPNLFFENYKIIVSYVIISFCLFLFLSPLSKKLKNEKSIED